VVVDSTEAAVEAVTANHPLAEQRKAGIVSQQQTMPASVKLQH
jgi:hypothetical protein